MTAGLAPLLLTISDTYMKRVLVIEDEHLIRSSISRAIRKDGFIVSEAKNSIEAMESIHNGGCDLAIVDLYLEDGLHGLQLIREIHRCSPEAKIIVITAHGSEEIRSSVIREGVNCFYDKPFEVGDIRNAIKEMLAEK
jgi:DNA-binding NtrC family response regulator